MSRFTSPAAWSGFSGAPIPVSPSILRWPASPWPWDRFSKACASRRRLNAPDQRTMSLYEEGNAILYSEDHYWSNLTWARLGTLPFLVLLCVVTFLWARRWFSEAAGFWAVLLLVCTSPILGHAGLATNDVACAAGAALALYQFLRWLEQPRTARCLWWGFATAFAVLCKFSNIPFLAACYAVGLVVIASRGPFSRRFAQIGLAACVVFAAGVGHVPIQPHSAGDVLRTTPSRDRQHAEQPAAAAQCVEFRHDDSAAVGRSDDGRAGSLRPQRRWPSIPICWANGVNPDGGTSSRWSSPSSRPSDFLCWRCADGGFVLRRWREHWQQSWQQVLTAVFPL